MICSDGWCGRTQRGKITDSRIRADEPYREVHQQAPVRKSGMMSSGAEIAFLWPRGFQFPALRSLGFFLRSISERGTIAVRGTAVSEHEGEGYCIDLILCQRKRMREKEKDNRECTVDR